MILGWCVDDFGRRLRAARRRLGLTQDDLARRTGVSVRAIRDLESGRVHAPRPRTEQMLAAVTGSFDAPPPSADVRVDVLGPLTAHRAGEPVEVGPPRQALLAGVLALHPGQPVAVDELAAVVWGERPPPNCVNLLHTYVSRLRRRLGAEALARDRGGYALLPDASDVLEFTDLERRAAAADGDRAAVHDLTSAALARWRGDVLAGAHERVRLHPTAVAVAQRRLSTALLNASTASTPQEHGAVVARLRSLAEPLPEDLRAALVRAVSASGLGASLPWADSA